MLFLSIGQKANICKLFYDHPNSLWVTGRLHEIVSNSSADEPDFRPGGLKMFCFGGHPTRTGTGSAWKIMSSKANLLTLTGGWLQFSALQICRRSEYFPEFAMRWPFAWLQAELRPIEVRESMVHVFKRFKGLIRLLWTHRFIAFICRVVRFPRLK